MKPIYYCVEKSTKTVLFAGSLPESWRNITGMQDLSADEVSDLSWAGYPDYGFLTFDSAVNLEILEENLNNALKNYSANKSLEIIEERDYRLSSCDWVVVKFLESGSKIPDEWIEYRQALRDINKQDGYPWDISFPIPPSIQ